MEFKISELTPAPKPYAFRGIAAHSDADRQALKESILANPYKVTKSCFISLL